MCQASIFPTLWNANIWFESGLGSQKNDGRFLDGIGHFLFLSLRSSLPADLIYVKTDIEAVQPDDVAPTEDIQQ